MARAGAGVTVSLALISEDVAVWRLSLAGRSCVNTLPADADRIWSIWSCQRMLEMCVDTRREGFSQHDGFIYDYFDLIYGELANRAADVIQ